MNRDLYEKRAGELYSPAHLNFYLIEKEQFPVIRKLLKLNYESEYSKAQLCGKKRVFAVK